MKKIVFSLFALSLLIVLSGCRKETTPEVVPRVIPEAAPEVRTDASVEATVNVVPNEEFLASAQSYCDDEHSVFICGNFIRVMSALPGGASVYHKADGTSVTCVFGAPGTETEECKELLDNDCETICEVTIPQDV